MMWKESLKKIFTAQRQSKASMTFGEAIVHESLLLIIKLRVFSCGTGEDTKSMHFYYKARGCLNSQSFYPC